MTLTFEFIFLYILIDYLDSFSSLQKGICLRVSAFAASSRAFIFCLLFSESCSALLLRSVLALTFRSLWCQLISRTCLALSLCSFSPSHKLPCNIVTVYLFVLLIPDFFLKNMNYGRAGFIPVVQGALSSVPAWHLLGAQCIFVE